MKLLSVSLLLVLAFAAGILFYRAALDVPAPAVAPTGPEPDHSSRIVLANNADGDEPIALVDASEPMLDLVSQAEPAALDVVAVTDQSVPALEFNVAAPVPADILIPYATSFDLHVAEPQPSTFDIEIAEATAEDSFDLPVAPTQLQTFDVEIADSLAEANEPPTTTIEAVPEGSRVRIESAEGSIIEADRLSLSADAKPQASAGSGTTPGSNADNPIPEFLRGQQLPPLIAGQKVVTIQVPVENWVDLGWGDIVRVEREMHGVGVGSDAGVSGTIDLTSLERVEIYALPQFAPENADTVAVCLKVNSQQARQLLQYRRAEGTFTLTVVQKFVPTPVYEHDEFPVPVRQPDPVPNDSTNLVPTQLPTDASAGPPADVPVYGRTSDFDLNPKTYVEPESHASSNDFVPSKPAPNPVDSPVPVDEFSPRPDDDFDPNLVTESEPRSSPDDSLDPPVADSDALPRDVNLSGRDNWNDRTVVGLLQPGTFNPEEDESLPEIEPAEEGTVYQLKEENDLVVIAGQSLTVETQGTSRLARVSGFDAKLIRVTATSARRMTIEGLSEGETSMIVRFNHVGRARSNVRITVVRPEQVSGVIEERARRVEQAERAQEAEAREHAEELENAYAREREQAAATLQELFPEADLRMTWLRDSLLLRGTVPDLEMIPQITEVAEQYAPKVLNQLRVADAPPVSEVAPRSIPEGKRVVSVNLREEMLRRLEVGQQVSLGREQVVRQVVEGDGHAGEVVSKVVELVAVHVTVFNVNREAASAGFVVSPYQVQALQSIPGNELVVLTLQGSGGVPDQPYKSDDAPYIPYQYSSEGTQPAAVDDIESSLNSEAEDVEPRETAARSESITLPRECQVAVGANGKIDLKGCAQCHDSNDDDQRLDLRLGNDPLRADIRALHDDVRKLIALLEQRVSDSDARDVENFEPPLNPSTGSADDAPNELEPAEDAPVPESGDAGESESKESVSEFQQRLWDEVGLRVTRLPERDPRLKGHPYRGGLLIGDVRPGSPFAHVGARTGDILVGLHVWETVSDESLQFVLNHRDAGRPSLKFYLLRDGEVLYGNVSLDPDNPAHTSESSGGVDQKPRGLDVAFAIPLYEVGAPVAVVPVSRALREFDAVNRRQTFSFHVGFMR